MVPRRGHRLAPEPALAKHHIDSCPGRRREKQWCLAGQVLHVAIERQRVREVASDHPLDRGSNRVPLAAIRAVLEDVGAGSTRQARGRVRRPVVHDEDVIHVPVQPVDHLLNGTGLVEGRNDRHGPDRFAHC